MVQKIVEKKLNSSAIFSEATELEKKILSILILTWEVVNEMLADIQSYGCGQK